MIGYMYKIVEYNWLLKKKNADAEKYGAWWSTIVLTH